jgi:hypothetical protein
MTMVMDFAFADFSPVLQELPIEHSLAHTLDRYQCDLQYEIWLVVDQCVLGMERSLRPILDTT